MAAIYSNGDNRWNILGFNFTKRDALSSLYKISMGLGSCSRKCLYFFMLNECISGISGVSMRQQGMNLKAIQGVSKKR